MSKKQTAELGILRLDKYLEHYGIQFDVKKRPSQTLFLLPQCIFNPSHKSRHYSPAAFIQDDKGVIMYSCFYDSCKDNKWSDARAKISGADSITDFCEK